jgi:hypothetical protein
MKRIFKYSIIALLAAFSMGIATSCDPEGLEIVKTDSSKYKAPVMEQMSAVNITKQVYNDNGSFTFKWSKAEFGASAAISYNLVISSSSKKDLVLSANIADNKLTIDAQTLYQRLTGAEYLNLPKDKDTSFEVYVTATTGSDFDALKSAPVTVKCFCETTE